MREGHMRLVILGNQTLNQISADDTKCSSEGDLLADRHLQVFENLINLIVHDWMQSLIRFQKGILNFREGLFLLRKGLRMQPLQYRVHRQAHVYYSHGGQHNGFDLHVVPDTGVEYNLAEGFHNQSKVKKF